MIRDSWKKQSPVSVSVEMKTQVALLNFPVESLVHNKGKLSFPLHS